MVPARATASGTPRCGSEYRDSTSPPRYPSLPQPSRRRTQHTRFTSRGLRGSQYTIPQPLWYTSTKCFGRITSTFPCTLLYTGLHRGQRYGTGGDMTEQGRCPPKPHRERSVHKGPDTQSAPRAQTRCETGPSSTRPHFVRDRDNVVSGAVEACPAIFGYLRPAGPGNRAGGQAAHLDMRATERAESVACMRNCRETCGRVRPKLGRLDGEGSSSPRRGVSPVPRG